MIADPRKGTLPCSTFEVEHDIHVLYSSFEYFTANKLLWKRCGLL